MVVRPINGPCMRVHTMALKLLLLVLAVCSLTAGARSDDDFAEFDDEEGEFDFDIPGKFAAKS